MFVTDIHVLHSESFFWSADSIPTLRQNRFPQTKIMSDIKLPGTKWVWSQYQHCGEELMISAEQWHRPPVFTKLRIFQKETFWSVSTFRLWMNLVHLFLCCRPKKSFDRTSTWAALWKQNQTKPLELTAPVVWLNQTFSLPVPQYGVGFCGLGQALEFLHFRPNFTPNSLKFLWHS